MNIIARETFNTCVRGWGIFIDADVVAVVIAIIVVLVVVLVVAVVVAIIVVLVVVLLVVVTIIVVKVIEFETVPMKSLERWPVMLSSVRDCANEVIGALACHASLSETVPMKSLKRIE
ncbi:hypothetical protein ElyMa_000614500 [Elysia marginata]|uniref:Uncharacterized protein n=1 Tax=Elysia marginata TaxID=1093978 RepID=A0AAV4G9G3_9GAST|nr:hypothetical protein ElyMa_000614500 [Elysia marginata]